MKDHTTATIVVTENVEQTQELGKQFAEKLQPGSTVFLYGNLGSGKTTFVQGVAQGLGLHKRLISPTFILMRTYDLTSKNMQMYHVDLYRIEKPEEIQNLGIEDIIKKGHDIMLIEWGERMRPLPKKRWEIHFDYLGEDKRKIIIEEHR